MLRSFSASVDISTEIHSNEKLFFKQVKNIRVRFF